MNPFLPEAIDEETHRFNAQVEALLATAPPTYMVPPEETRLAREEGRGVFGPIQLDPNAEWRSIAGPGSNLPIRVMLPPGEVRGVYLHFHGGGWVLGRPHHADVRLRAISDRASVAVVRLELQVLGTLLITEFTRMKYVVLGVSGDVLVANKFPVLELNTVPVKFEAVLKLSV